MPGHDEPRRVGFDHALIATVGYEPKEFILSARGHSNEEQSVVLRAMPRFNVEIDEANFENHKEVVC
jgi:hypothetical protein